MRAPGALIALVSLAAILISAGSVLTKDSQPQLSVSVEGVPGYIYYARTYDLTIEYANHGGDVTGLVELVAQLPETFALAENIGDPMRHGERLVWTLDGLKADEQGSIPITVQGTLPQDLTNAVYDLPGYEGHTAFVEGFQMPVWVTAGSTTATTVAVADTGNAGGFEPFTVVKTDGILDGGTSADPGDTIQYAVTISYNQGGGAGTVVFTDTPDPNTTLVVGSVTTSQGTITSGNTAGDTSVAVSLGTVTAGNPASLFFSVTVNIDVDEDEVCNQGNGNSSTYGEEPSDDPDTGANDDPTCTPVALALATGSIVVHKECNPDDDANGEFEITLFNDNNDAVDSETIGCDEDATFNGLLITDGPFDAEETDFADGFEQTDTTCDNLVPSTPATFCEIENTQIEDGGTIIIEKDVDPEPDDTVFSFSDNIPGCNLPDLADDGAGGLPNSFTCSGVPAGDYQVSEDASSYTLVDIDCEDPDGNSATSGSTATIDVDDGETIRCIFHNVPANDGSITIIKETNPDTNDVFFDFDGDLGDFDLEDDDSVTFINLSPGTYEVSENEPSGWSLLDIVCNHADVSFSGDAVFIDLDPGEHITCEFINQKLSVPTATPTKTPIVVIPVATATPTRTAVPPVMGPVRPPSAGDGGLMEADGLPWVFGVLSVVAAGGTAWVFIQHRMRRTSTK